MPFLSTNFLAAPSLPGRKRSQMFARRDESEELSDLDVSFASNVSLNSPPNESIPLSPGGEPMDISPAPPKRSADLVKHRARALTTSGARLFGNDLSNGSPSLLPSPQLDAGLTSKETGTTSGKRIQRSALPTEWLCAPRAPEPAPPISREPSSPMDDAMDVDTSYHANPPPSSKPFSLSPSPSAPSGQFKPLYFQAPSPRRSFESPSAHMGKRRSLSPDAVRSIHEHSSPALPSSPSEAKLDRMSNGAQASRAKPSLQGLGAPSASFLKKPRRPVLSAMLPPSDHPIQSAYPSLAPSPGFSLDDSSPSAPPVRRAFSAFLPPAQYIEPEEEDTSFEGPDMSSPAQAYSQRQHVKTIRRCDGTEDFRPLTGTSPLVNHNSPSSRFLAPGLPGFGDNEAHGKILPCHRVTEDGLMRIKYNTLDDLLSGKYKDKVSEYVIVDCRFDYEFNGGHITGAININTTSGIEDIVLGGLFGRPEPSVSGDNKQKKILIFHCEFSAKRAPTFAKHLRAKDRALNNHIYPRIYFPEVYILEGGYCEWFKNCSHRCSPQAYVTMDDPNHASSRREDLDHFRKARFGRVKSYSYTDSSNKPPMHQQQVQPKRNTAPSAPQSLFAAATAARSRRGGALTTLAEDANTTLDGDETDTDIGDSPCPPPTKATTFKGKKLMNARPIIRAETYGPARMPY